MSCNCNANPCSCASANCACPPDYSVAPATLTCQGTTCVDTLNTQCIFTDTALSCINKASGTDLSTVLVAMDAKICQCGSCSGSTYQPIELFYVDSHNPNNGDGSIANPYKTIDLVYAAVIGSGSASAPTNVNAKIVVFAGDYDTALNIYIPGSSWHFFPKASVNYIGSSYFIDTTSFTDGTTDFTITGYLEFQTMTGGFLHNKGSYTNTSTNKKVSIEAQSIIGSTPLIVGTTLIFHELTYGTNGTRPISTYITLQNKTSSIVSGINITLVSTGGILFVDLREGEIGYGINRISGGYVGVSNGVVFSYVNTDSTNANYLTNQTLKNGTIWSVNNSTMVAFLGIFNYFLLQNLTSKSLAPSVITCPTYFLTLTNPSVVLGGVTTATAFTFLLDKVVLDPASFSGSAADVIHNVGASKFGYLEMQNCRLYAPLTITSTLALGNVVTNSLTGPVSNIMKGLINFGDNIPQYANNSAALTGGLVPGDVYVSNAAFAKVLQITY